MAHNEVVACATQLAREACSEVILGFVPEGRGGGSPWEQLQGQINLRSAECVATHQPNCVIGEVPCRQAQAQRPALPMPFQRRRGQISGIHDAYRQYGYRLAEIAAHLGVHSSTVSRRLKQIEQANAWLQVPTRHWSTPGGDPAARRNALNERRVSRMVHDQ